jgi:hypothetical protein
LKSFFLGKSKFLVFIFFIGFANTCDDPTESISVHSDVTSYAAATLSGLGILHGQRQGLGFEDSQHRRFNYRYITSTIINDSLVPLHLSIELKNVYHCPNQTKSPTFRVFLLPRSLTPRRMHLDSETSEALKTFLNSDKLGSVQLDTILQPHQEVSLSIGVLTATDANDPGQLALLLGEHDFNFYAHDSLIWAAKKELNANVISLGLDFFQFFEKTDDQGYLLIPCGTYEFLRKVPASK